MKVGDLVLKAKGDLDLNETGIILEVIPNSLDHTIVVVNSNGTIKKWYSKLIKVINMQ